MSTITSAFFKEPQIGDPVQSARALFDLYSSKFKHFPQLWVSNDIDLNNLINIFKFFADMQAHRQTAKDSLIIHLGKQLKERWNGRLLDVPNSLQQRIQELSELQIRAFEKLDPEFTKSTPDFKKLRLLKSALELFVAGALCAKSQILDDGSVHVPVSALVGDPSLPAGHYPEPDGAQFFYWAEFALIAMPYSVKWQLVLSILLRAERIFFHCYGRSKSGDRTAVKFSTYSTDTAERYLFIDPKIVRDLAYPPLDNLLSESEKRVKESFPAGIDL